MKISRPVPEKPISEAMQQGKEPLRSFGDLMQFLKKSTTPEETPQAKPAPSEAASTQPPANEPGLENKPDRTDPQVPGEDDVGV